MPLNPFDSTPPPLPPPRLTLQPLARWLGRLVGQPVADQAPPGPAYAKLQVLCHPTARAGSGASGVMPCRFSVLFSIRGLGCNCPAVALRSRAVTDVTGLPGGGFRGAPPRSDPIKLRPRVGRAGCLPPDPRALTVPCRPGLASGLSLRPSAAEGEEERGHTNCRC